MRKKNNALSASKKKQNLSGDSYCDCKRQAFEVSHKFNYKKQQKIKIKYHRVYNLTEKESMFPVVFQRGFMSSRRAPFFGIFLKKMSAQLDAIPRVEIEPSGVFKYILINVHDKTQPNVEPVTIVRGIQLSYHSDIYDVVQEKLHPLDCEPIGGGRISHDAEDKKIFIYGYSQSYGRADHELTAKLIKKTYPDYAISVTDDEY